MEIDTLFGLPAHPLIVHTAVVLLRLASSWKETEPLVGGRLGKVSPKVATGVLTGASLIGGVGANWTVIGVGHSGATSVWHDTTVGNNG